VALMELSDSVLVPSSVQCVGAVRHINVMPPWEGLGVDVANTEYPLPDLAYRPSVSFASISIAISAFMSCIARRARISRVPLAETTLYVARVMWVASVSAPASLCALVGHLQVVSFLVSC